MTDRSDLPLMLNQQELLEKNRLLQDQLDHAQSLISTPVKDFAKLELQIEELTSQIRTLEKELIKVYRDKAKLNQMVSDLLERNKNNAT